MRHNGKESLGLGCQHSIFCAQHSPTQSRSSYREPRCKGTPGAAFGYCPRSKRSAQEGFRRWSAFVRDRPFFLTPRTRLDASSTHPRRWVELGCKTRVEPGSRCACERGVRVRMPLWVRPMHQLTEFVTVSVWGWKLMEWLTN